jgi:DNA sulfur modification protein DndB
MGDLEYFASVVTLGEVARLIDFVEEVDEWTSETPPALKLQRKMNTQRVERELVPYLLSGEDHFYSSITVEIRPAPRIDAEGVEQVVFNVTQTFPGGLEFGMLTLDGTETLYALDGQHRLKSIELAIRQQPRLARDLVSLIMIPFQSVVRSQTLFSDLNRYAKPTSKSISLLFTHREGFARLAKSIADTVPILRDRVNMESTSLSSNSRHFITLSTLYEMTKTLADCDETEVQQREAELVERLTEVWRLLTESIDAWSLVASSEEHPAYLRQRELCMHGVAQQSIALAVKKIMQKHPLDWQDQLGVLGAIDWRLTNPDWQGIAMHGGRVNNTATSVKMLARSIQQKVGSEVTSTS